MNHNINSLKSIFENNQLEQEYLDDKWIKVSSFYFKVIIFFSSAASLYLVSLFIRNNAALKNIINPIIFITFPIFLLLKNDDFKKNI